MQKEEKKSIESSAKEEPKNYQLTGILEEWKALRHEINMKQTQIHQLFMGLIGTNLAIFALGFQHIDFLGSFLCLVPIITTCLAYYLCLKQMHSATRIAFYLQSRFEKKYLELGWESWKNNSMATYKKMVFSEGTFRRFRFWLSGTNTWRFIFRANIFLTFLAWVAHSAYWYLWNGDGNNPTLELFILIGISIIFPLIVFWIFIILELRTQIEDIANFDAQYLVSHRFIKDFAKKFIDKHKKQSGLISKKNRILYFRSISKDKKIKFKELHRKFKELKGLKFQDENEFLKRINKVFKEEELIIIIQTLDPNNAIRVRLNDSDILNIFSIDNIKYS